MQSYDLYGFAETDLEEVHTLLTNLLKVTFQAHDSSFLGEYYLYKYPDPHYGELRLIINRDPIDGESISSAAPIGNILLYSENIDEPLVLEALLAQHISGVRLLERKIRGDKD